MKFRKKPVVIEAQQITFETISDVAYWCKGQIHNRAKSLSHQYIKISTLEGVMEAQMFDWVIKGISGEFYPCKPDIFKATYERAE